MSRSDTEARGKALTTLEGWRQFINEPVKSANGDTAEAYEDDTIAEDGSVRGDEDARINYHVRNSIIATPILQQVSTTGRRLTVLNRYRHSARRGLMVTGRGGTGKTTAVTQLGKTHELARRRRDARGHGTGQIPVMYVQVPSACTPRMLAVEFARFVALPLPRRANLTDVVEAVCGVLTDTGCDLVIVDEMNNISLTTRSGSEVSDQLKYFAERLPVTFVYAGIDLESTLFSGSRGQQLASRFAVISTHALGYATRREREQWQALVAAFERTLRLRRHPAGALARHAHYLHDRTSGLIGALADLFMEAAIEAIVSGEERITRSGLDNITLSAHAESHYRDVTRPRRRQRDTTRPPAAPEHRDVDAEATP